MHAHSPMRALAHKDNLNPAGYFNYGAKHSIYRPLSPQQTTAHSLFSLFPASPQPNGLLSESFNNTCCNFIPFTCCTSSPLLYLPKQNRAELLLSQVFHGSECAAELRAHTLLLRVWLGFVALMGARLVFSTSFHTCVTTLCISGPLSRRSCHSLEQRHYMPVLLNYHLSVIIKRKCRF